MPIVSVITPAHSGRAEFLAEAGHSLAEQELPPGWQLQWLVQEDGPGEDLRPAIQGFGFADYRSNGERLGIATSRNLALTRARGELVHVLDSDDKLLPCGLATAITAFADRPRIHWVAAQTYDLMPDGSQVEFTPLIDPGPVEPGETNDYRAAKGRWPFHPNGITVRTATIRALGGWVANPRAEDGAMLAALTELTPGYFTPEITWMIRIHPGRTTKQDSWDVRLIEESEAMTDQRIEALRFGGLRLTAG